MGQRTSVYLDDGLHAAAEASGVPLAELLRRSLADQAQTGASLQTVTARQSCDTRDPPSWRQSRSFSMAVWATGISTPNRA